MRFIKDCEFIRGNCPMTKEEIRIIAISKMDLKKEDKILDIGGGTGSVSIQASKLCKKVITIERDLEALKVLGQNKEKFQADNLKVIAGEALELADSIDEAFDAIFIGGSGGNIKEILCIYTEKLKARGKIVLTFITIKNLYLAYQTLENLGYAINCSQIQVSQVKSGPLMLFAQNPIFILWGERKESNEG